MSDAAGEQTGHRLERFFHPRSIALIGAGADPHSIRGRMMAAIVEGGYAGKLYPVTRSHQEILGHTCYATIDSLPVAPDLAIVTVPASVVPQLLEQCGEKGIRAAIIISSGFEEQGDEGALGRVRAVREIVARYGMVVNGPNAEGFYHPAGRLTASFSPALYGRAQAKVAEHGVAIVSQSGGVGFAIFDRGDRKGLPVSYAISMGNEVDLEAAEVIDYLLRDPGTNAVAGFIEGFKSPAMFATMAQRAADCGKPLVLSKVGKSSAGARASLSHTGSLAGSYPVYEAVMRRHGVTLTSDLDELVDVVHAFSRFGAKTAKGRRVAVLTASGGAGIWMSDACEAAGLEVVELDEPTRRKIEPLVPAYGSTRNPVDITAQGVFTSGFSQSLQLLLDSPSVDMAIVVCSAIRSELFDRDSEALAEVNRNSDKPVVFCAYTNINPAVVERVTHGNFPFTNSMPNAAGALALWLDHCRWKERQPTAQTGSGDTDSADPRLAEKLNAQPAVMCEHRTLDFLRQAHLPIAQTWLVDDAGAAVAAWRQAGRAVALKLQSPAVPHKSDVGGVRLNLDDADAVAEAFESLQTAARSLPDADLFEGVLVQPMARPGVEMIVGISRDERFGPMLMLGTGGTLVEVLRDVQLAPVPLRRHQAQELIDRLKGRVLLEGARGAPPADIDALIDLLMQLSGVAHTCRDQIRELDLNPVIVHSAGAGLSVVDALLIRHVIDGETR